MVQVHIVVQVPYSHRREDRNKGGKEKKKILQRDDEFKHKV